jgi:hypothetical protein
MLNKATKRDVTKAHNGTITIDTSGTSGGSNDNNGTARSIYGPVPFIL